MCRRRLERPTDFREFSKGCPINIGYIPWVNDTGANPMTKNALSDLLAQKAALEQQIADVQREQRSEAIGKVKALMAEYGLTVADISSKSVATPTKRAGGPTGKVAAKYRNPATGDTWSGRGLKPKWLSAALADGKALTDFTI
jgi:DNA-binding protein H-NS